ncbi:hypothetical protein RclHR1_20600005 [Rhizophagus clarus]|nr:hypothetical protein RclHR1_20600005 [Rhizophagus clarus]
MREKLESSINFIRTLPIDDSNYNKNLYDLAEKADDALKKWRSHEKSVEGSSSSNKLYLANTPSLGIMLMTSYVLDAKIAIKNGQAPFNTVLDINFCGRTSGSDITDVTIELGEIKLSSGSKAIKKTYRQLLLRLAVLGFVVKAMNINGVNDKCNLVGKIFVPRTSEVRIQPSWEDGITFPDSANCHIDIITIGEKQ